MSRRATALRSVPEPLLAGLAAHLIGLYLALHAFFAPEFLPRITGISIPIVALLALLLPVIWFITSPAPLRFMQTGIAKPFILLLVWWIVSALVMSFRGYAMEMMQYGMRFHFAPVIFCGLLLSVRRVGTAILGYGTGFIMALGLCWKYGEADVSGRFCIPGTSLGNPNDLALNLLVGAAFLSILLVNGTLIKRLIFAVSLFVGLYFVLKTGSRANFVTLGVVLAVAMAIASAKVRMMLVLGGLFAGAALVLIIPKHTWTRLTTFESASREEIARDQYLAGAIGSTEARKELQIRAIKLTLQNPIFGVGPRMFVYALNDHMKTEGYRKGTWQHPHNTYLDISSETGLVGLGLYVSCIIWCLRANYRSVQAAKRRPDLQGALGQSCCLLFASVVFGFGTLFCSIPYVGQMPFLLGVTAANWLALRDAGAFTARPAAFFGRRSVLNGRRADTQQATKRAPVRA